jgi:hypothetical protein
LQRANQNALADPARIDTATDRDDTAAGVGSLNTRK